MEVGYALTMVAAILVGFGTGFLLWFIWKKVIWKQKLNSLVIILAMALVLLMAVLQEDGLAITQIVFAVIVVLFFVTVYVGGGEELMASIWGLKTGARKTKMRVVTALGLSALVVLAGVMQFAPIDQEITKWAPLGVAVATFVVVLRLLWVPVKSSKASSLRKPMGGWLKYYGRKFRPIFFGFGLLIGSAILFSQGHHEWMWLLVAAAGVYVPWMQYMQSRQGGNQESSRNSSSKSGASRGSRSGVVLSRESTKVAA